MYHLFTLDAYKTGELNCYPNITKEQFYSYIADFGINWGSVLNIIEEKADKDKEKALELINCLILREFKFTERSLYPYDETLTFALYKHTEKKIIKCTLTTSEDWFFMTTCFPDFLDWLKEQLIRAYNKKDIESYDYGLEFTL